jgi:hypothetical protein
VEAHAACEENPFWCRTTGEKGREEKRSKKEERPWKLPRPLLLSTLARRDRSGSLDLRASVPP